MPEQSWKIDVGIKLKKINKSKLSWNRCKSEVEEVTQKWTWGRNAWMKSK